MKKCLSILIISLLLSLCFSVNSVSSEDTIAALDVTTLYVDDDYSSSTPGWGVDCFNAIQNAIDNASDGDTVFIYKGIYYDKVKLNEGKSSNVILNKKLHLIGEDKNDTIIHGGSFEGENYSRRDPASYYCGIYLETENSIIEGVTITNCYIGIFITNGKNNHIKNNILTNITDEGVKIENSEKNQISNNIFYETGDIGINSRSSNENVISNNKIFDVRYCGIYSYNSNQNIIFGNNISLTKYWIYKDFKYKTDYGICDHIYDDSECKKTKIYHNVITGVSKGISVEGKQKEINGNNIYNCSLGIRNLGINNLIFNNNLTKNKYGIFNTGFFNKIFGNNIENNKIGIELSGSVSNRIYENNLINNNKNAFFRESFLNKWGKNYWNESRNLPICIKGGVHWYKPDGYGSNEEVIICNLYNFDWHPAKEPYDI